MDLKVGPLQHWTLVARDVATSKKFYTEVLGATEVDREWPPSVILGDTMVDIFAAEGDQQPSPGTRGQHHAYDIKLEDFDRWVEHLKAKGIKHQLANHGLRRISIYVEDPDGYHLELTAGIATDEQGKQEIEKRGIRRLSNPAAQMVSGA
jgi:catechol 2,3-dioxygenase-like lactoylglutathione lyase family enzyme